MSIRGMLAVIVIGDSGSAGLFLKFISLIFNIGNISSNEFNPAASKPSIRIITLTLFESEAGSSDTSTLSISILTSSKLV